MSVHHWIQGHCTKCGVRREKVRVQGPCFIPNVQPKLTAKQLAKAKEMAKEIFSNSQAWLDGSAMVVGQEMLFTIDPTRSIEPHKKRRAK